MKNSNRSINQKIAGIRRTNPLACPPAIIQSQDYAIVQRKVQKSGTISVSAELPTGVQVNVARIDAQTFLISSHSEGQVKELLAGLPPAKTSPFAAISERFRGIKHESGIPRVAPASPDEGSFVVTALSSEEMSSFDASRTGRHHAFDN